MLGSLTQELQKTVFDSTLEDYYSPAEEKPTKNFKAQE